MATVQHDTRQRKLEEFIVSDAYRQVLFALSGSYSVPPYTEPILSEASVTYLEERLGDLALEDVADNVSGRLFGELWPTEHDITTEWERTHAAASLLAARILTEIAANPERVAAHATWLIASAQRSECGKEAA